MQRFRLIHQKLHDNHFFEPLLAGGLFKFPFPTKNFLRKFFVKMHRFRHIHQKLSNNHFFGPLLAGGLINNTVLLFNPRKNDFLFEFSLKIMKRKNIYFIYTKHLLLLLHLLKLQFSTKNFLAKFFIKEHRFLLIHQKLNSNGFFSAPRCDTFVLNSICFKRFHSKIFHKSA